MASQGPNVPQSSNEQIKTNLLAWWSLDDASNTTRNDFHSNGEHLTDVNSSVAAISGKVGNAADFNSTSDVLRRAISSNLRASGWTNLYAAGWISTPAATGAPRTIGGQWNVSSKRAYTWRVNGGNLPEIFVSTNGSDTPTKQHSTAVSADTPTFLEFMIDETNDLIGVAINGGSWQTAAFTGTVFDTDSNFTLGARDGDSTNRWVGWIDEWLLKSAIPDDTERALIYNSGNGIFYPQVDITNNLAVGNTIWDTPYHAGADDSFYADCVLNPGGSSYYLWFQNFAFTVPGSATINGIVVSLKRKQSDSSGDDAVRDFVLRLIKAGSVVGDNKAAIGVEWPSTEGTANYGSSSDLWGTTWTPAQINASNFGFALQVECQDVDSTASVNLGTITVYYTDAGGNSGSITEGIKLGDTVDGTALVPIQDGMKAGDTFTETTPELVGTVLDGAKQGESYQGLGDYLRAIADGAEFGDSFPPNINPFINEGSTLSDLFQAVILAAVYRETALFSDALAAIGDYLEAISDLTFLGDAFKGSPKVSLSDAVNLGDTFEGLIIRLISEGSKHGDSYYAGLIGRITEGQKLGDSYLAAFSKAVAEGSKFGDGMFATLQGALSNEGSRHGESLSGSIRGRLTADGALLGDSATALLGLIASILEGAAFGESWSTRLLALYSEGSKAGDSYSGSPASSISKGSALSDLLSIKISTPVSEGSRFGGILSGSVASAIQEGSEAGDLFAVSVAAIANLLEGSKFGDSFQSLYDKLGSIPEGSGFGDSFLSSTIFSPISEGISLSDAYLGSLRGSLSNGIYLSDSYLTALLGIAILEGSIKGDAWVSGTLLTWVEGSKLSNTFLPVAARLGQISEGSSLGDALQPAIRAAISEGSKQGELFSYVLSALGLVSETSLFGESLTTLQSLRGLFSEGLKLGDTFVAQTSRITGQIFIKSIGIAASISQALTIQLAIDLEESLDSSINLDAELNP